MEDEEKAHGTDGTEMRQQQTTQSREVKENWREAGVYVQPMYIGSKGGDVDVDRLAAQGNGQHKELQESVLDAIETALFVREGGFNKGGFNSECLASRFACVGAAVYQALTGVIASTKTNTNARVPSVFLSFDEGWRGVVAGIASWACKLQSCENLWWIPHVWDCAAFLLLCACSFATSKSVFQQGSSGDATFLRSYFNGSVVKP
eukprot:scaffold262627_cov18-Tisochrysis_lutea.AAC.2